MLLGDVLQEIIDKDEKIELNDGRKAWDAATLKNSLHRVSLKKDVHRHPMYIAIINPGGYLGEVLYRIKPSNGSNGNNGNNGQ